jgi:hypothetical protein
MRRYIGTCWNGLRKITESLSQIANFPEAFRIEYLSYTNLDRYRYTGSSVDAGRHATNIDKGVARIFCYLNIFRVLNL